MDAAYDSWTEAVEAENPRLQARLASLLSEEGALEERLPLSLPAVWRAAGCAGGHGGELR